jgi:hypothetical protein
MCKEIPVIPVDTVVDKKRKIGKGRDEEKEEKHKGLLTPPPQKKAYLLVDTQS